MTPKQKEFVLNKLRGLSNRDAVIAAGYSSAGAKQQGTALMKHAQVRAALLKSGFDFQASRGGFVRLFQRSAGRWSAVSPMMPKRSYSDAIEFLTDAMNCEDIPVALRVRFASALLPYTHRKIGRGSG